jgi:hypothetical protein
MGKRTLRISTRRRGRAILGVLLASAGLSALAFDTGHHSDLTGAVLTERGFGETSTKIVQVSNWLTDYYSTSPTSRDVVQSGLEKLHFDNLYDSADVAEYWGWLVHNARAATRHAAESDDPVVMLVVMGLFLHAAQDFYAHSNWVELHPREPGGAYRSETWLSSGPPEGAQMFTGTYPPHPSPPPPRAPEHGGYDSGLNKDSHVRPLWDEAYVFAYFASHELVELMRVWAEQVRPGFWDHVLRHELDELGRERLDFDVEAAFKLSMWVKGKGADGHWKGDQSGSARYMSKFAVEWTSAPASAYVEQIKSRRVHLWLTEKLYSGEAPPPLPEVRPFREPRRVVLVRTSHVEELRDKGGRVDPGGKADLYAVVDVDGQRYVDRVLREKRSYSDPWFTLHVAKDGKAEIPIRMEVWDQDTALRGSKDPCDLHPLEGKRSLDLLLRVADGQLMGDVQGRHDGPESAFAIAGGKPDNKRVAIRCWVAVREVKTR